MAKTNNSNQSQPTKGKPTGIATEKGVRGTAGATPTRPIKKGK